MAKKQTKKDKIKQKLTYKFRLVILNEDTFQERFSMKLSRLNVFVFGGLFSILLVSSTIFLIAFTSLKEFIPGYSSTKLKRQATRMTYETDSLKQQIRVLQKYTNSIQAVLKGDIKPEKMDSIYTDIKKGKINHEELNASKEDSLFREKIESKDRFPLYDGVEKAKNIFFAPITGNLSETFNGDDKHYGVDVVAELGTPVKAIADGTVILSEWTADTGYILTVQHTNDFISVYKHNGSLLKEQGEQVKSGEAIANVGSTGELTTGPHLHFELWNKGIPVNPQDYIDFE